MSSYYVVTGATAGIGEAICRALLSSSAANFLIGVGRSPATIDNPAYRHVRADLSDPMVLCGENLFDEVFGTIPSTFHKLVLINNAALLNTAYVGDMDALKFAKLITCNVTAPGLLCNAFVKRFQGVQGFEDGCKRQFWGSKQEYEGWAGYCSSKAAVNRFSTLMQEEQVIRKTGIKVYSIYPGIVETGMLQAHLRVGAAHDFSTMSIFKDMHEAGELYTPDGPAEKILHILGSPMDHPEVVYDIRNVQVVPDIRTVAVEEGQSC